MLCNHQSHITDCLGCQGHQPHYDETLGYIARTCTLHELYIYAQRILMGGLLVPCLFFPFASVINENIPISVFVLFWDLFLPF